MKGRQRKAAATADPEADEEKGDVMGQGPNIIRIIKDGEAGEAGDDATVTEDFSETTATWQCDANLVSQGMREHWILDANDIVILHKVGEGGFGQVQTGLLHGSTQIAVKTCRNLSNDAKTKAQFASLANEMRLLRRVRHPNIVLFFGVCPFKENWALVIELVEGMDLQRYTVQKNNQQKNGQLDMDGSEARDPLHYKPKLLLDTASGMHFLHSQKPPIMHRDMKPSNILVELVAVPPRAKLTDFGVSVLKKREGMTARVGTRWYMAPEVAKCEESDLSADVYSFGCTVGFVFLARAPEHKDLVEELSQVLEESSCPEETVSCVAQCLEVAKEKRPPFGEIRVAFNSWVRGETADASFGFDGGYLSKSKASSRASGEKGSRGEKGNGSAEKATRSGSAGSRSKITLSI